MAVGHHGHFLGVSKTSFLWLRPGSDSFTELWAHGGRGWGEGAEDTAKVPVGSLSTVPPGEQAPSRLPLSAPWMRAELTPIPGSRPICRTGFLRGWSGGEVPKPVTPETPQASL